MSYSSRVLEALSCHGTPYSPSSASELSNAPAHVYAITNGPHVLQVGHGVGERATDCMRGSLARRHAKAWICAISEVAFGAPNRYSVLGLDTKEESESVERAIHAHLGIRTNRDAATLIEGLTEAASVSLAEVNEWLWDRVRRSGRFSQLTAVEQAMAEELHDLVTYGTVFIQRTSGWQPTRRGDLLEGNTLQNAGKAYLIPVFEKLTNGYLRYGIHRPTPEGFAAVARNYRYVPRRAPFRLEFPRAERAMAPAAWSRVTQASPVSSIAPPAPKPLGATQAVAGGGQRGAPPALRVLSEQERTLSVMTIGGDGRAFYTRKIGMHYLDAAYTLAVNYKDGPHGQLECHGRYALDLHALLHQGLIREERSRQGAVTGLRMTVWKRGSEFYIQLNQDGPRLRLPRLGSVEPPA